MLPAPIEKALSLLEKTLQQRMTPAMRSAPARYSGLMSDQDRQIRDSFVALSKIRTLLTKIEEA